MPKGPNGERRPADVIGAAVLVGRIATGEAIDPKPPSSRQRAAKAGGNARAKELSPEERKRIAQAAAARRWGKQGAEIDG